MSIKIKNNNMGMYSPNSVNISIYNNGINNDDELEIDKIFETSVPKDMVELINKYFADCVRKMNEAKTIEDLDSAYNMAKNCYIKLLKERVDTGNNYINTCEFEKVYNRNKRMINNSIFLEKIIKLFS